MPLSSTASIDPDASGKVCCSKVSHLRTSTDRSSSPLPLIGCWTNWLWVPSVILKMKLRRNDSPSGLSEMRLFRGPIWQLSESRAVWLETSISYFISLVCCCGWEVMRWQSASQQPLLSLSLSPDRSGDITTGANKLSHGCRVYSLTLFCVCWLMALNLLRGFVLVWNWGQKCLRISFS